MWIIKTPDLYEEILTAIKISKKPKVNVILYGQGFKFLQDVFIFIPLFLQPNVCPKKLTSLSMILLSYRFSKGP